jgi:rhamnosyltransferase
VSPHRATGTPPATPAAPRATVILRCKNSQAEIGAALAALFSQDFRDFELLVVDSGSTDRTLEIVGAYPHRLLRIAPGDYVPGPVLNRAAAEARGAILVFQNSDCAPLTPDALGRLVGAFDDPVVMAAFARQVPRPEAWPWVRREYAACFPPQGDAPPWIPLSLPFSALRRTAWEQQPFYDETWGSEDTAWGVRARARGWTVRYLPDCLAMHSHNYTLKQLYGRRFIEGEADVFIYGEAPGPARLLLRAAGQAARDVATDLRAGEWTDVPVAPVRRAVDFWGYWQGARHGARRRAARDTDVTHGQRVVLDRHVSKRD